MVRWIAMKFGMNTHFDPVKPSDRQKFDFINTKMADGRCLDMFVVDKLTMT